MSPAARAAAHRALDSFLDALAAEEEEQKTKPKRRRGPACPALPPAPRLSPELQAQLDTQLEKSGYKKAG